jgi:hypothetical protein
MLQLQTLPAALSKLLTAFRGCFTVPTFGTFVALLTGLIAQPGRRTVCGMLVGAGLNGIWHHQRAHRFFSRAVWSVDRVCLVLLRLVVDLFVPAGQDLEVVVDDTLFKRSGRHVHAARWQHDGSSSGPSRRQLGRGNGWVVAALNVRVDFLDRVLSIPVGFALWGEHTPAKGKRKNTTNKTGKTNKTTKVTGRSAAQPHGPAKRVLACQLVTRIAEAYPDRRVHVTADTWYAGMGGAPAATRNTDQAPSVPDNVTVTSRPRSNATFHDLPTPKSPGTPGRRALKGNRLGRPTDIAATATFNPTTVTRYGRTTQVQAADQHCLWYYVYYHQIIRLILVRDSDTAPVYAIITTDLQATPAEIIARYANRWAIEVVFHDAKNITGVGEAHNRTPDAVRRTVPFGFIAQAITIMWYAQHGHTTDIVARRRKANPWYRHKTQPSYLDMIIELRRALIHTAISTPTLDQPKRRNPKSPTTTTLTAA